MSTGIPVGSPCNRCYSYPCRCGTGIPYYVPAPAPKVNMGWECPRCGATYNPTVLTCSYCTPRQSINSDEIIHNSDEIIHNT